ncbi:MAG: hypothetical protein IJQ80_02250, partial [Clostridia bacterium]|nr:hypothetical protein [Clostridia bacterium]
MSDKTKKRNEILDIFCASCGSPAEYVIATQNYHCRYCGEKTGIKEVLERKNEYRSLIRERVDGARPSFRMERANCTGCGAEVVFAEGEALTDCAFCGRALVRGEYTKTEDFPEVLIPFKITPEEARRRLLEWCDKNRCPEAKVVKRSIDSLEGFYLPYILVKGPTGCTVKRENTSRIYRCRGFIEEKFVNTSDNMNNAVLDGTEPYDTADLCEFDFSYLAGQRVKIADLKDDDAARRVESEIAADYEPFAAKALETRAVKVDPGIGGMMTMSAVLPAYYLRADNEVIAAVNGQTGKVAVRERRDRFLLPWQLKPIAAILALVALSFFGSWLVTAETVGRIFFTGILSMFFIIVVLTAYHDHYGGTERFRLRRRIMTSDESRPDIAPLSFYETLDGEERPVKLRFTTPTRVLRMASLAVLVTFLPLIMAFVFNGFSTNGLHPGGAAVWLCIFVPVAPIYFIKFGIMHLHERPLI